MKKLLLIPVVLYIICLFLPPFTFPNVNIHDVGPGIFVLLIGWAGVLVFQFAWFANPLFFFALLAQISDKRKTALNLSVIASVLSLNAFAMFFKDQIPSGNGGGIVEHFVGAWFWLGAIWSLMVINILIAASNNKVL